MRPADLFPKIETIPKMPDAQMPENLCPQSAAIGAACVIDLLEAWGRQIPVPGGAGDTYQALMRAHDLSILLGGRWSVICQQIEDHGSPYLFTEEW